MCGLGSGGWEGSLRAGLVGEVVLVVALMREGEGEMWEEEMREGELWEGKMRKGEVEVHVSLGRDVLGVVVVKEVFDWDGLVSVAWMRQEGEEEVCDGDQMPSWPGS